MPQDDAITCSTPSCLTARQVTEAVLKTKLNWTILLSGMAVGLLTYSVLVQAPDLRAQQAKEASQLRSEMATEIYQRITADREARVDIDRLKEQIDAVEKRIGE
jgi:hypothetical protein